MTFTKSPLSWGNKTYQQRYVYTTRMTTLSPNTTKRASSFQCPGNASRGWLIVLAISLLMHAFLIDWGSSMIGPSEPHRQNQVIVTAELKALPPVPKPLLAPKAIKPKTAPAARKSPKATARVQPAPEPQVPDTPIRETITPITAGDTSNNATPVTNGSASPDADTATTGSNSSGAPAQTAAVPETKPAEPAAVHYETKPPPSAELKYDVKALNKGQTYYGSGKITWQTDGGSYTINGEAGALFISALDFKSEGEINDFGVAPVLYTEKKFRKSATNTHFHRERNTITFSASTNSYPRSGGEQDRASIVWELASIGRGDAGKMVPGGVIDLFVAGDRDAETWRFQILGQEEITVGTGTVTTWHLARKPQQGSYEKTLDIWLAPQQQWYPVKLRYTENNGDYLDMSLSKLKRLDASTTPG